MTFQAPFQKPFAKAFPQQEGEADGWVTPADVTPDDAASLKSLYDLTDGDNWSINTNWGLTNTADDWYGLNVLGGRVDNIDLLDSNNLVGDVSSWVQPTANRGLDIKNNNGLSGDVSGWLIPNTMVQFFVAQTSLSGDVSGWVIPANLTFFYANSTSLSGVLDYTSAIKVISIRFYNLGLGQSDVDANLLGIYNRRAAFTRATPVLDIGGTNSAPSGVYQDATPPTTGNEYKFKLINDPDSEGFNTWVIVTS